MSSRRTAVTKRACDGCKIRKIKCAGGQPCQACTNARIKCTYIRVQQPRGPQRLRSTTKYLIDQTQRQQDDVASSTASLGGTTGGTLPEDSRLPTNILASPLYIYHVRMYPVWPIVDVEHVISRLQQDPDSDETLETYALATAVAAATIAQLRLGSSACAEKSLAADTFAAESLRVRASSGYRSRLSLNSVRTSFFLHVYYENQKSGGSESLLYLREAISLAQMMHLHRESAYAALPKEEQQMRRRVLWLLFVTERGVCILHKLPVVLKTNIATPDLDVNDEPQVLPAFLKLLGLFRLFEQSKMFSLIEEDDPTSTSTSNPLPQQVGTTPLDKRLFDLLQDNLQDSSALLDHISDVQKADLCVTRQWMRMILWRFSSKTNNPSYLSTSSSYSSSPTSPSFPVMVAKDLLTIVSQLPRTAIEAHGLGMELKLYEIANSLADAVMNLALLPRAPVWDGETRPSSILTRLHSILSTFRGGGNKELVEILYRKMAEAQATRPILYPAVKTGKLGGQKTVMGAQSMSSMENIGSMVTTSWTREDDSTQGLSAADTTGCGQYGGSSIVHSSSLGAFEDALMMDGGYPAHPFDPAMFDAYMQSSLGGEDPVLHGSSGLGSLSPSLPADSVEMLIGDFIAQIPSGHYTGEESSGQNVPVGSFVL
ncbi:hypothetical protein FE257_003549 [Aspergillus nanangensis]|uniref:Zn(2)-C6 fungal-type domain-containing protein n=1 Tax=Aspergillus nanangensis TaxID=2582783 RepID=A0AAD4CCT0_ASPNN|nr:hypothetical protein FE257_003549 [Aspergillus nanangensis]